MGRPRKNHAYNYFLINPDRTSQCLICKVMKKTSHGSNLLRHLQFHHSEEYHEAIEKNALYNNLTVDNKDEYLWIEKVNGDSAEEGTAELADGSSESSDSNNDTNMENFVFLGRGRARCTICHITVCTRPRNMRAHMKTHEEINNGDDIKTDTEEPIATDDVSYSEVVYLDEPLLNAAPANKRSKPSSKSIPKFQIKSEPYKMQRAPSPQKEKLSKHEEECEKFGAYIMHLLKSTPQDVCSKLQMDIVSLIMSEKIKIADNKKASTSTPLPKHVVRVDFDNDISVNEISDMNDIKIGDQNEVETTVS